MGVLSQFAPAAVFIETGLGHGQSLVVALQQPFAVLHSIEIDHTLIEHWFGKFPQAVAEDPRLTIWHGSSPDILPRIIDPARSTMFWLDAHYSAGQYTSNSEADKERLDARYGQCPLLQELAIIKAVDWRVRPWIYIDDADCFRAPVYEGMYTQYDRAQYPSEAAIKAALPTDYQLDVIEMSGAAYRATPEELL